MQKNITEEGVYSIIKSGFSSFRILAKADLIKYWGKLSREQKCKAARALVKMEDMASIPGFYFSRATTENDYINRIKIWIESNAMNPEKAKNAFYVVWSPLDYVVNSTEGAFIYDSKLKRDFYRFCDLVQDWEYGRTSNDKRMVYSSVFWAGEIEKMLKDLDVQVKIMRSYFWVRPIKKFFYLSQK